MVTKATFKEELKARKARTKKETLEPRTPTKPYPKLLERKYGRQLSFTVEEAYQITKLMLFPRLPGVIRDMEATTDRFDDYVDTLNALFQSIRLIFKQRVPESDLENLASTQAQQVNAANAANFTAQVHAVAGIKPFVAEPWLVPTMKSFTKNNVSLITSVHESYFKDVENVVYTGIENGRSTLEIEKAIRDRTGVSKSRAKLIARDQTGKLNSNLSMKRATGLGVKKFRWATSADERVRSSHSAVNNKIYTYKDGAVVDGVNTWPGQPIQCRCSAIPILSSIDGVDE